ncbi:leucine-rich repeat domain-containing protein [Treponema pedis]|uniref:Cell surface protein n=2 Tax=Treponema pedis TaxID=409322 RepID=S6A7W4_9SPIR|nr:leucine-rich repeat domain-containing protein [Treponema pedis]AGT42789.1 cell surface protein [Treponema pedis str. T A4]
MKHKKLVSMIGMLVLLFSTVSCSKNNKVTLSDALEKNDITAVEEIFSSLDENSLNKLTTETPSSIGDFSYTLSKDETKLMITGYNGSGGLVIIPSEIEGYPVKWISKFAFKENNSITSVVIPPSIEIVGAQSFYNCDNLTSVFIPSSVSTIGDQAFFGCDSLSVVKIMPGLKKIGRQSFSRCNSLVNIVLPEPLETISNAAFKECENLLEVHLADTIQELGAKVFSKCKNLHTANIPKNIKKFGGMCFEYCYELHNLEIPEEIKKLVDFEYDMSFEGCKKLPIATRKRLKELGYTGMYNIF